MVVESVSVEEGTNEDDGETAGLNEKRMFGVMPMDDEEEQGDDGNEKHSQTP